MNNHKINDYLDNIDIIYWINLDESVDRNIYISTLLNTYGIENKRIKGINGKKGEHKKILIEYNSKSGTDSEYGCTLSHILALLEFYISGDDRCIIAEDDLSFDTVEYWNFSWEDFEKNLPKDYDIYLLGYIDIAPVEEENELHSRVMEFVLMHSYIITPKGAKKLIEKYTLTDKEKRKRYKQISKVDFRLMYEIDDKYFKINYYSSRDQDNKPIKLASIKSYLGLPGYITANINDDINKELGDFKYFNKNYKINIEEQMKNKLVSVGYNYIFDNN